MNQQLSSTKTKHSIQVALVLVGAACSQTTKIVLPPWQRT